jgi:hypothetical protein
MRHVLPKTGNDPTFVIVGQSDLNSTRAKTEGHELWSRGLPREVGFEPEGATPV